MTTAELIERLERLLDAATEGPWYVSAYYSGTGPDERCFGMIVSDDDMATGIIDENAAPCGDSLSHDLDLICFLRNNAAAILALMEREERLRGALASCPARTSAHGCPNARAALAEGSAEG